MNESLERSSRTPQGVVTDEVCPPLVVGLGTRSPKRRVTSSIPIDDRFYSASLNLRLLSAWLADETCTASPKERGKVIAAVALIVVNVIRLRTCGAGVLGIPCSEKSQFFKFGRHGYAAVSQARKGLEAGGYLELAIRGYWDKTKKTGHTSRFAPTDAFIDLLAHYELGPADIATSERRMLVELREKDDRDVKVQIPWPREKKHVKQAAVASLTRINVALTNTCIALHVTDQTLEAIQEKQSRSEDGKYVDFFGKE